MLALPWAKFSLCVSRGGSSSGFSLLDALIGLLLLSLGLTALFHAVWFVLRSLPRAALHVEEVRSARHVRDLALLSLVHGEGAVGWEYTVPEESGVLRGTFRCASDESAYLCVFHPAPDANLPDQPRVELYSFTIPRLNFPDS